VLEQLLAHPRQTARDRRGIHPEDRSQLRQRQPIGNVHPQQGALLRRDAPEGVGHGLLELAAIALLNLGDLRIGGALADAIEQRLVGVDGAPFAPLMLEGGTGGDHAQPAGERAAACELGDARRPRVVAHEQLGAQPLHGLLPVVGREAQLGEGCLDAGQVMLLDGYEGGGVAAGAGPTQQQLGELHAAQGGSRLDALRQVARHVLEERL